MSNESKLKNYVCTMPFTYMDVQVASQFVCCPSWCPTNIQVGDDIKMNWFSKQAESIRESVYDGSYSHCNKKVCPALSSLINTDQVPREFMHKDDFDKKYDIKNFSSLPDTLLFGFDRSCNLKCPSCRNELIPNDDIDSDMHKHKERILDSIHNEFSSSIKSLIITGSGDPFYSKLYRTYLTDLDANLYPNLESIQIVTNGILLTEKMWNKLNSKEFIKKIEISIDAGTKETYENVTRLGGNWDVLMENLHFLSSLDTLDELIISMVVSELNYKEMILLYNIIVEIFKNSSFGFRIHYRRIVHWTSGLYTIEDINKISIFSKAHNNFNEFKNELLKIHNKPFINHNFHDLLT